MHLSVTTADASEWKHHEIDRRNASSEVEYRLMFMARVSDNVLQWPGHAYMMAGEIDHRREVCRLDTDKAFGFHPVEDASTAVVLLRFSVPGKSKTSSEDDVATAS